MQETSNYPDLRLKFVRGADPVLKVFTAPLGEGCEEWWDNIDVPCWKETEYGHPTENRQCWDEDKDDTLLNLRTPEACKTEAPERVIALKDLSPEEIRAELTNNGARFLKWERPEDARGYCPRARGALNMLFGPPSDSPDSSDSEDSEDDDEYYDDSDSDESADEGDSPAPPGEESSDDGEEANAHTEL